LPEPLLPVVIVIQLALLLAVQLQPTPAVTLTPPLLALDTADALEEEME
jgi:isochorismate synthase EntC